MAFDFSGSSVGEYGELVLSVPVAPRFVKGRPVTRAAFFPFLVGTTTKASRDHAIELWHLPHFMDDIDIKFNVGEHEITVSAAHGGSKILDMRITDYEREPVEHYYQAFEHDKTGTYMATMAMNAQFSENEEERGSSRFTAAFTRDWKSRRRNSTPFRDLDARRQASPIRSQTIGRRSLMPDGLRLVIRLRAGRAPGSGRRNHGVWGLVSRIRPQRRATTRSRLPAGPGDGATSCAVVGRHVGLTWPRDPPSGAIAMWPALIAA